MDSVHWCEERWVVLVLLNRGMCLHFGHHCSLEDAPIVCWHILQNLQEHAGVCSGEELKCLCFSSTIVGVVHGHYRQTSWVVSICSFSKAYINVHEVTLRENFASEGIHPHGDTGRENNRSGHDPQDHNY